VTRKPLRSRRRDRASRTASSSSTISNELGPGWFMRCPDAVRDRRRAIPTASVVVCALYSIIAGHPGLRHGESMESRRLHAEWTRPRGWGEHGPQRPQCQGRHRDRAPGREGGSGGGPYRQPGARGCGETRRKLPRQESRRRRNSSGSLTSLRFGSIDTYRGAIRGAPSRGRHTSCVSV
jgi:hypothetical protein